MLITKVIAAMPANQVGKVSIKINARICRVSILLDSQEDDLAIFALYETAGILFCGGNGIPPLNCERELMEKAFRFTGYFNRLGVIQAHQAKQAFSVRPGVVCIEYGYRIRALFGLFIQCLDVQKAIHFISFRHRFAPFIMVL